MPARIRRPLISWVAALAVALTSLSAAVVIQAPAAQADTTASGVVNTYQKVSAVSGSTVRMIRPTAW